jgi:hypothetical protein
MTKEHFFPSWLDDSVGYPAMTDQVFVKRKPL